MSNRLVRLFSRPFLTHPKSEGSENGYQNNPSKNSTSPKYIVAGVAIAMILMLNPIIMLIGGSAGGLQAFAYSGSRPKVALTEPASQSTFYANAPITVSGTASSSAGIAKVEVSVKKPDGTMVNLYSVAQGTTSWSTTEVIATQGTYNIFAKATDNSGRTQWASASVTIVSAAPSTASPVTSRIALLDMVTWGALPASAPVQYGAISGINMFKMMPQSDGTWAYDGQNIDIQSVINTAHSNGKKVLLSLSSGSSAGAIPTIIGSQSLTTTSINNVIAEMKTRGYDGVDIDFEGTYNWSQFITWLSQLSSAVRSNFPNAMITWDVYASGWQIQDGAPYVDKIIMMLYDGQVSYDPSQYMPAYASLLNGDKSKLVGALGTAWETDTSLDTKLGWMVQNGYGGFMIWHDLGCDTCSGISPSMWNIIMKWYTA